MITKGELQQALTEISQVIDFYKGSFSFQGMYSMREILAEVDVHPDGDVVHEGKDSPLTIKGRSGKPRRPCGWPVGDRWCVLGKGHTMPDQHMKRTTS